MPIKIEVTHAKYVECDIAEELKDGYLAFSYPGKFIGFGDTMEEALIMARMRYNSAKKRFIDKLPETPILLPMEKEDKWVYHAKDRESKIDVAHAKWGIKDKSTWNPDNVDKTT